IGQRLDSLDALAKAAAIRADERLRDQAIAAMALPDVRLGPSWNVSPEAGTRLAFDGQYRHYARAGEKGGISICSLPDNLEIRNIDSALTKQALLILSPDGSYVVGREEHAALKVWRVSDGKAVLREEPRPTSGWAFSPDSRQL